MQEDIWILIKQKFIAKEYPKEILLLKIKSTKINSQKI
jgi:hypothetical protein